jgi:hypothetical protein
LPRKIFTSCRTRVGHRRIVAVADALQRRGLRAVAVA